MDFGELLRVAGDEPVFETSLLLAGDVDPRDVRRQLSRWTGAGRLYQLRRGLYAFAPPYQKIKPHPFVSANRMVHGSYVSCQSALAQYGIIPEAVPVVVSVASARPVRWDTPLGAFEFRHMKTVLIRGYRMLELGGGQKALVATPEKALLDLAYLHPGADSPGYLRELRLQNTERLDLNEMQRLAQLFGSGKLRRVARLVVELARTEAEEYHIL
jgi:predicted transcriptional regulator of viral defense system